MEIPRLQLHHPQADMASILLWCGTGRPPLTNGDGGKEPHCCGKLTPIFPRNDAASECFGTALWTRLQRGAEAMVDDQIQGSDGVRNIVQFFDDHHAPYQTIIDHEDFQCAVHAYERSSTETYTACGTKKRELFQRYEKALNGDCLPNFVKAKVVLRHSSLTEQAAQARNECGQKLFEAFRQGENEVCIASAVRWDTQLKGLVELERRCQEMMQKTRSE